MVTMKILCLAQVFSLFSLSLSFITFFLSGFLKLKIISFAKLPSLVGGVTF